MQATCTRLYPDKIKKMNDDFNLILMGYGGQGVLTIADIIASAALKHGHEVKQAELHGLAQRGGSLDCHIRFGKNIHSQLVRRGKADLILSFELMEALRAAVEYANKDTRIVSNNKVYRFPNKPEAIKKKLSLYTKNVLLTNADDTVRAITGEITSVNIFLLGFAIKNKVLPLEKEKVWEAITERIGEIFLEDVKKVFEASFE